MNSNHKIIYALLLTMALTIVGFTSRAQSVQLSLEQAVSTALQNSMTMKNAQYDVLSAQYDTRQLLGTGLPQVSASGTFTNYLNLPTSVIPGAIFGQPGQDVKVKFGVPQNTTVGLSASQLLFNGSWLVGLQASRAYADLKQKQVVKNEWEIRKQVSDGYQTALVVSETLNQLQKSHDVLASTLEQTKGLLKEGFAEQQDVDQLQLTLNGLDMQMAYISQQVKLSKDVLKVLIGLPISTDIELTDKADALLQSASADLLSVPFAPDKNLDVQILQGALGLQELNVRAKKAAMLPTFAAFYNLQTQALRREFDVFNTKLPWYAIQLWGLQLNIPILTGGSNLASIKKAEVEVKRYQDMLSTTRSSSELEYRSARNEYEFALNNLTQARNNITLAEGILEKTNVKFKEGVTTSFDVTQRTNQLVQAQSNYVDAMQKVLAARTRLAKSLNIQ